LLQTQSEHSRNSWLRRAALEDKNSSTSSYDERYGRPNIMYELYPDDSEEEEWDESDGESAKTENLEESDANSEHSESD
jgi:hypothetical protein